MKPIKLHSIEDFEPMRKAGKFVSGILDKIGQHVHPGQTTGELDRIIDKMITDGGAVSATKGYTVRGNRYNHASCISVNHVVCHGVPGEKKLKEGDILNIDVTVVLDGWHGDSSRMYKVGKTKVLANRLIDVTYDAMMKGISMVKPGNTFGDIGHAIQAFVESNRMSTVIDFCGHGIGQEFHMPPNVIHAGESGTGQKLEEGMFFTVEPMVNVGKPDTKLLKDGWTAVTKDKKLSAQWEHTVGVTSDGVEIFTLVENS